jgi:hypothetical protein
MKDLGMDLNTFIVAVALMLLLLGLLFAVPT